MNTSLVYRGFAALAIAGLLAMPAEAADEKLSWRPRAFIPTGRYFLGAAAGTNGQIYAIGGQSTTAAQITYLATNEAFDPVTNTWRARANLPTARGALAVAAAPNGKIYALGGQTTTDYTNVVEEYDPTTDRWATKSPLSQIRTAPAAVAAGNGTIYLAGGGAHHSSGLADLDEYDPATDTWRSRSPMPTGRQYLALAAATNGKLYAIGGLVFSPPSVTPVQIRPVNNVEEYDPATDAWTVKAPLPAARWSIGAVGAHNGKIYVVGGQTRSSTVYDYDPATDTWATAPSLTSEHSDAPAGLAPNGTIYVVGGFVTLGGSTLEEGVFEVPRPTVTATPTQTAPATSTPTVTPTYSPTPRGTPAQLVFLPLVARAKSGGW